MMVFVKFSWLKLFVLYINIVVLFIKTLLTAARSLKNIFKANKYYYKYYLSFAIFSLNIELQRKYFLSSIHNILGFNFSHTINNHNRRQFIVINTLLFIFIFKLFRTFSFLRIISKYLIN